MKTEEGMVPLSILSILNPELFAALIAGIFTLLGVMIGILASRKSESEKVRKQFLIEAYSDLFSAYFIVFPLKNLSELPKFLSAIEKTKLFCSEESEIIMDAMVERIRRTWPKPDDCLDLLKKLRESAKAELR